MRKIYLLDFDIANWQWACNHYQPQETGPSLVQGRPCKENLSFPFPSKPSYGPQQNHVMSNFELYFYPEIFFLEYIYIYIISFAVTVTVTVTVTVLS
jgi:hypothetical protein